MSEKMTRRHFHCPSSLYDRVERWSKANGCANWSDAVRALLRLALDAADTKNAPLPPDALEYLEAYRREVGAKTLADALKRLCRSTRAAEANVDDGARPALRIVTPAPPPPPAEPATPEPPAGLIMRTLMAFTGG